MHSQITYSQLGDKYLDAAIKHHKELKLEDLSKVITNLNSLKLKQLFAYDLEYLKEGTVVQASKLNLDGLNGRDSYIGKYILADLLKREGVIEDSNILKYYEQSLQEALMKSDSLVINEVLIRLNTWMFLNGNELSTYKKHLNKLFNYRNDSIDYFYSGFHEIGFELMKFENNPKAIDSIWVKKRFQTTSNYASNHYIKGLLHNLQSIFYSGYMGNQKVAQIYGDLALKEFGKVKFYFARYAKRGVEFNNAIILFEEGKFSDAIPVFKRVLKTENQLVYRMYGYDWLHKCYDSLGDYGSAYRYFKKLGDVKDSLSLLEHAREIKAIEAQYDFAEKELELEQLANEKNRVQTNFNTLVPFFGIALVLVLVALYLYRKYRKRSELLQEEKDETLKRIRQLKKIVVKNHIILKDKTKVYIADLVYIKAEDHYLKLFLSNEKHHLVRGKIKNIKQQLPPNFIQCHRSYIVNTNFIKQANRETLIMIGGATVPLSRTYKDKF